MQRDFKMSHGEKAVTFAKKFDDEVPVISVTGNGRYAYLWVGGKNGPCYATLSGKKTLLKLRSAITKALR
jgi:hypothetical protein